MKRFGSSVSLFCKDRTIFKQFLNFILHMTAKTAANVINFN